MIPAELTLNIWKGCSFNIELISQYKKYTYNPNVHRSSADMRRSYMENIEFYGFTYEFINFAEIYVSGDLQVYQSWKSKESPNPTPIFTMSTATGDILFTDKSVILNVSAENTEKLPFVQGVYDLDLVNIASSPVQIVDRLIFGNINISGI